MVFSSTSAGFVQGSCTSCTRRCVSFCSSLGFEYPQALHGSLLCSPGLAWVSASSPPLSIFTFAWSWSSAACGVFDRPGLQNQSGPLSLQLKDVVRRQWVTAAQQPLP